jgi:hypothetical protein
MPYLCKSINYLNGKIKIYIEKEQTNLKNTILLDETSVFVLVIKFIAVLKLNLVRHKQYIIVLGTIYDTFLYLNLS